MKLRLLSLTTALLVMLSSTLQAGNGEILRQEIGRVTQDGEEIVLFDDGLWRFSDRNGERCTDIPDIGKFCALPSKWSRLPQLLGQFRPTFMGGNQFSGEFYGVFAPDGYKPSAASVERMIARRTTTSGGLQGSRSRAEYLSVNGAEWHTTAVSVDGYIKVFSVLSLPDRFIIAETGAYDATLYHSDHKAAHVAFLAAIELD